MTISDAAEILMEERENLQESLAAINESGQEYTKQKRFFAALGMAVQAMGEWENHLDIGYDYDALAKQYQGMIEKYEIEALPIRDSGVFLCPSCHRRIHESYTYCNHCGKRVGWSGLLHKKSGKKPQTIKRKGVRR